MTPTLRQAAADAFNLLVYHGKLDKDYLYNFIEDSDNPRLSTRAPILASWQKQGLIVPNYNPAYEYVILWKEPLPGKGQFSQVKIVEIREFVASAVGLRMGKKSLMS